MFFILSSFRLAFLSLHAKLNKRFAIRAEQTNIKRICLALRSIVSINFAKYCRGSFLLGVMALALSGCVSKQHLENEQVVALNNNLAQLQQWRIKGKIAWLTPNERKSAYINWHQNKQVTEFTLNNLLGINLASLDYDGNVATLQANGQTFQDSSPSTVIYRATRWQVPIELLKTWIKGAASSNGRFTNNADQQIARFENGLIQHIKPNCINCDQWSISYDKYEAVTLNQNQYQLPTQITMYNEGQQATIKIRISEWSS